MQHDDMVCMLWEVRSLMCTSHVAGNTQRLVSIGKVRKIGLWWLSMQWQGVDKDIVEVTVLAYGKNEVVQAGVVSELMIEWRR